ncbi:ABC transporter ATP-binding protein [Pseudovibrio sp. Tun.PSC04-5.I4]|uniref:ABC transporter ATP-binding protein n=1 Tax=Pseudovibrio sp. Tun.PSC04-5.I4 TaxID=1798213 RepID=UPI000885B966|nr:ABC transporter ATP-binding protein [Pseudovibrio sp. Tun.PSC04-5.I4]SDQ20896.1 carbohydrate ABC transporter ATP-binding protein, CUT1 family [Pseudovibrio sp. Tun.PSC04-5.I4]
MLELKNVSKQVDGVDHIRDVSLRLESGSLNVLLGPTLSGKTTLMRLMAGLDKSTSGQVLVNGQDMTGVSVRKRDVAMVYQQFINYPALSVYENIASPLRVAGLKRADIESQVRKAADLMKLSPYLDRLPLNLSGGQQQRTAIARALVKGAHLVLMDEPLANLDYKLREELRDELPKIFSESGAVFVYATTEPTEALLLGGRTATLSEGCISQFGETIDVYRNPQDIITAQTFSDPPLNILGLTKTGSEFRTSNGTLIPASEEEKRLPDGHYKAGFRPHHLYLHRQSAEAVSLPAKVDVSEITGSESFVHVTCLNHRWVALEHGIHNVEVDAEIEVFVDAKHFMIFDDEGRSVASLMAVNA